MREKDRERKLEKRERSGEKEIEKDRERKVEKAESSGENNIEKGKERGKGIQREVEKER